MAEYSLRKVQMMAIGDAPNLEDEAGQEGWGELGHQLQLLEKASVLHH